jgi:hypothetical protein
LDLSKTIQELHAERDRLTGLIRAVEEVQQYYASAPKRQEKVSKRGRKSMDAAERRQVSERMRKYWAQRREAEEGQDLAATG